MDPKDVQDALRRKRAAHFSVKQEGQALVPRSSSQTVPGIVSSRGCAFAGARGVVFGPITDVANVVHGPIGCAFYTWDQRRNLARDVSLLKRCFSTDLREKDVIFGGEQKLLSTILDVHARFRPAAVAVYATCPVGLIGDDIDAVCERAAEEIDVPVIPLHAEGFRGVNQSKGHKIASDALTRHVVGTVEPDLCTDYDVNVIGEYNIGGEAWEIRRLLTALGLRVHAVFTGDSQYRQLASAHRVKLNLVHCQRSIASLAEDMKKNFGVPFLDISMYGTRQVEASLAQVAAHFGLEGNLPAVLEADRVATEDELAGHRARLKGKKVVVYVGGSRAWHFIHMFEDLGMEVAVTGTEFGHKVDYEKMLARANEGTVLVDDLNHAELCEILTERRPDLVGSGIKEMHAIRSRKVPYLNLHSYGGAGPFIGHRGLVNLAREIRKAMEIESGELDVPVWASSGEGDA